MYSVGILLIAYFDWRHYIEQSTPIKATIDKYKWGKGLVRVRKSDVQNVNIGGVLNTIMLDIVKQRLKWEWHTDRQFGFRTGRSPAY